MGKTTHTTPYKVSGCDYLLVKSADIEKQRKKIGCVHIINGINYKIVGIFHDCCAIEVINEKL